LTVLTLLLQSQVCEAREEERSGNGAKKIKKKEAVCSKTATGDGREALRKKRKG